MMDYEAREFGEVIIMGESAETNLSTYDDWREKLEPFLSSKLEEFHMLGLERVTEDELWELAKESLKKNKVEMKTHQIVGQLMRLSVNDYLNKIRIQMFKGIDIFNEEDRLF
ncbi:MAG: post-transcriptional regulator [Tuberibacillus sp.]